MRFIWVLFVALFLLTACSYSAKSVITITDHSVSDGNKVLESVVRELRKHRDGCFSERNATMLVTRSATTVGYQISNKTTAMDLLLSIDKRNGSLRLELDEWSEEKFSDSVARCHKQLMGRLEKLFDRKKISTVDSCKKPPCR